MAEIIDFVPKSELDSARNLDCFIELCKHDLTVFGDKLKWDEWKWPKAGNFTKLGTHAQTKKQEDMLDKSFIDFSKAYFRYQQGHNPTGTKNELKALRVLEAALLETNGDASLSGISYTVLDVAAQFIRNHYQRGADYQAGRELERLAKFITSKKLVANDLSTWRHPIPRKKDDIQTGPEAKARRDKKMPSIEVLDALAEIFALNPQNPKDLFITSTFAMSMCAPSRMSEILELPVDCEVEEIDSKGILRYGWRFVAGKGFGGDIKWIPTEMIDIAKEAVMRIRNLTEPSRKLAKYIESNKSDRFYRHSNCPKVDDDIPLSALEAAAALGFQATNKKAAQSSLGGMELETVDGAYTLNSLWTYVKQRQPKGLPWVSIKKRIKFSNSLFCMNRNLIGDQRGTSPVLLWLPNVNVFNNNLSPRLSLERDSHKSIFDRYGYFDAEGNRLKLSSHQARNYLNTLAQRGGLSQLEIAKWSGRADIKQNRTYNHMSEYEMVARAEELDTSLTLFGPSGEVSKHVPITLQEFNMLEKGPLHITEFGVCVHDYTMTPCSKFRDCLNCNEQVCIKGDHEKLIRIKQVLELSEQQLAASRKEIEEGTAGADRWYEHQELTVKHVKELVFILENSDVPDGAQIKLKNENSYFYLHNQPTL